MKKLIGRLLLIFCLLSLFTTTVSADMGPKASLHIQINNAPDNHYYVALFTKDPGYGRYGYIEETGIQASDDESRQAYEAFLNHHDPEGYKAMNYVEECSGTNEFSWTYYPPDEFKIAIYNTADKSLKVSDAYKKEAFDAVFIVEYGPTLKVEEVDQFGRNILTFLLRALLTTLIEVGLALLFGYREKKEIITIVITNLITQILLNLFMAVADVSMGGYAWLLLFPLGEGIVWLIEMIVYLIAIKRKPKWKLIIYTLLANGITFVLGIIMGFMY